MPSLFVIISSAGPKRDLMRGVREQAWWDDHAAFIDALVDDGVILLGGPFPDEGGAMLVVHGESEQAVRDRLVTDPWYVHGILRIAAVHRWELFIDKRSPHN